ncbi:MAG: nuclear transport factor 2 family protein [Tepidiformaceae bacterium]
MTMELPEDQFAIERLYARYASAIGQGDAQIWAECFTADGRFSNSRGSYSGRADLSAYAEGWIADGGVRYWMNNLLIEGTESGIAGSCYLAILRTGAQPVIELTGIYTDTLVVVDGEWVFASRHVARD